MREREEQTNRLILWKDKKKERGMRLEGERDAVWLLFFLKGDTLEQTQAHTRAETESSREAAEDETMTARKREFVKIMNPREEREGSRKEEEEEGKSGSSQDGVWVLEMLARAGGLFGESHQGDARED